MWRRCIHSSRGALHENPLGLPSRPPPPTIPRRTTGPPEKRAIANVGKLLAVASGKGGVGKSTVAVNLACALARQKLSVGILDLDVFGPSLPTLLGLRDAPEPVLTPQGALVPLANHGLACMSMGFLVPGSAPVVWRGLMVQKAVQQLLFDVAWPRLDVLLVDLPPGTGDVALSLGQLAKVDGAVVVSTPQDVALLDVQKGVSAFRKLSIPILGLVLNMAHFTCPSCATPHRIFGPPHLPEDVDLLAELPVLPRVSVDGDAGVPPALTDPAVQIVMDPLAREVWRLLNER
ncbi:iron-sulfur protein IND1 [Exidia glandulosa HHB12029]|uniref:Iron-sulfur protein IND1 n=1 Tax=Exidia glandulosa HHB12029 TaxID=1314781 RepID=A0A166A0V7_EXIGL|nr:iron-sulfur protein IND1 [Exidia glandulosa HHB12029]